MNTFTVMQKVKNEYNLSFGCELEWSDIDRRVDIPVELGSWEGPKIAGYYVGSEIDIVNTKGMWRGHATDPLCLTCPVGGEIHTQPSNSIETQVIRIMKIMNLFNTVSVACTNHGHIHVAIPGIKQNLAMLKNIFKYVQREEKNLIEYCCGYSRDEAAVVRKANMQKWVKDYLLVGDGKSINPEIYAEVEKANSVREVIKLLETTPCDDWFWDTNIRVRTNNSHRTAFNLFNLTKGETVEFRIFRASINPVEIYSTLYFAQRFVEEAIKGENGKSVPEILGEGYFKFPRLNFNEGLAKSWQNTRHTKGRCGCFKHYTGTCSTSEDPIIECNCSEGSNFNLGLKTILELVKLDFRGDEIKY